MPVRPVRIGLQVAQHDADFAALRRVAAEAEDMGVDVLFTWDHFFPPGRNADGKHFECWMTLAAWAESTSTVHLGPLVSSVGYRHPDLLADMARTVDHISAGRVVLGLGAGFKERDYVEYGYEFGSVGERIADLGRCAARIRHRLATLQPPPRGPLPLLIGGGGERKTLRIVAEHADIWHTFAEGATFTRKSLALDEHCRNVGRDPHEIERSVLVGGDPDEVGTPLLALGVSLFVLLTSGPELDLRPLARWLRWRERLTGCERLT